MPRGVYPHKPLSEEHKEKIRQLMTGRKFSEESKRKMSLAQKGNQKAKGKKKPEGFGEKVSKSLKGRISPLKGRKIPIEERLKRSISQRKRVENGNNNFWKGGINKINLKIRGSLEYQLWRESVFARDDFTCQHCNQRGGKLNADHIKPFSTYPALRFELSNGRTLCIECHRKTDTWGMGALKVEL